LSALLWIVICEAVHGFNSGLHLDWALLDSRSLDGFGFERRETGRTEFVPDIAIAAALLHLRNGISPGGARQPVDGLDVVDGSEVEHAFFRAHHVERRLRHRREAQDTAPAQPERRRHRRDIVRAIFVDGTDQDDGRSEIEYRGFAFDKHSSSPTSFHVCENVAHLRPFRCRREFLEFESNARIPNGSACVFVRLESLVVTLGSHAKPRREQTMQMEPAQTSRMAQRCGIKRSIFRLEEFSGFFEDVIGPLSG
jgi:hypothetical protein